jgi:hypothetical protein
MTYFHNQLEIVKKNLRNNGFDPEAVEFRVSKSKPAFFQAEAEGEKYDFILIDGAHKIRYVTQDLRWTRLLNVGGLLCMHDYNQNHKGVMWSAERLLRKFSNYQKEALVDSLIVIRKIAPSSKPEINMLDILWANLWSQVLQWERNLKKHLPFLFKKK